MLVDVKFRDLRGMEVVAGRVAKPGKSERKKPFIDKVNGLVID